MIEHDIRRIVATRTAVTAARLEQLSDDDNLFAAGLRSFDTVQVMLALEEAFDVEFPDAMLNRSTFATVAALRVAVEQMLAEPRAA